MALSIQPLTDDSKFSQALRFEVLEQLCPPELVSELLTRCHAWGERERSLNQLLVVYYVIALSLFRRLNLAAVLRHLVRGLRWLWSNPCLRLPTAAALVYRRRQLGTPVLRHLFQRVEHRFQRGYRNITHVSDAKGRCFPFPVATAQRESALLHLRTNLFRILHGSQGGHRR